MAGFRKILAGLRSTRGVTSAEYAILAVGVVVVVGAAVSAFSLLDPMSYAGSAVLSGQATLRDSAR